MGKKEILNNVSLEEIRDVVFLKFDARPENQRTFTRLRGIVFESLIKHDPPLDFSIPRNKDPDLARLEQVIIPLMEQKGFYTPDIILMDYQDKGVITIKKIGEIKFGFWEIEHAITQQENFLSHLRIFLENFDERVKEKGLVFRKPLIRIKVDNTCSLFYVVPQDINLPEKISSVEVIHSSFSSQKIHQITRDYLARSQALC